MSAAEQEYDVCGADGCDGVPVATWSARIRLDGASIPVWATVPACAAHDQELGDAASWAQVGTIERFTRDEQEEEEELKHQPCIACDEGPRHYGVCRIGRSGDGTVDQ